MTELNKNGKPNGMHPNSQKNLGKGRVGNNHAKKGLSITRIERGMLGQVCPYTKVPGQTWAEAIADSEMRDALESQKARDSIKDRLEGRVPLPIGGEDGKPILVEVITKIKDYGN